jgi:glycosyltransferase involved in cell wall biosynthesis
VALSVLMFCPQFRPVVGGAERQAEKLAKALVKRGLHVTVLTPKIVGDSPDFEEDTGVAIHRFSLLDICKRFPKVRGLGPLNLLSIGVQTRRTVSRHLKSADIVHTHIASPMTAFAMQTAQRMGVPVLCKVAMAGERTDLGEVSRIGLGGPRLSRVMVHGMDRWVATTEAVRESLIAWKVSPEKIVMIPNGVNLIEHQIAHRERDVALRFLYLGRLSTNIQRDVPTLIKAFDRVADEFSEAELALVGDGDLYQETENLVAQARNRARIQMPGIQDPAPWLGWADCMVLPSRQEGLSNALLEGMVNGLACIANDIPQNREVLDNGRAGVLVPVGDEDHLVNELLRMATEPGLAEAVGKSAMQRVEERYSIESVADQYIELYKQLTNGSVKEYA